MNSFHFKWLISSLEKNRSLRALALSMNSRLDIFSKKDEFTVDPSMSQTIHLIDMDCWGREFSGLERSSSFLVNVDKKPGIEDLLGWTSATSEVLIESRLIEYIFGYYSGHFQCFEGYLSWGFHIEYLESLQQLKSLELPKHYIEELKNVQKHLKKQRKTISEMRYLSDGIWTALCFRVDGDVNLHELRDQAAPNSICMRNADEGDSEICIIYSEQHSFCVDFSTKFQPIDNLPANEMFLKFHGVRGSRPTHKKSLLEYGGNSTSIEFILPSEDFLLFVDCGSGLAHRGIQLGEQCERSKFYWLITHTHWDHILGLPFFEPFYNADHQVQFFASQTSRSTFDQLLTGVKRTENLPIPIQKFQSEMRVQTIPAGKKFQIGNEVNVSTYQINHQGITLAYRVEYKGNSAAIVTDNAPIEDGNYLGETMAEKASKDPKKFEKEFNQGLVDFLRNCHTVVFDTHFTEENLKPDWGHSTPERALEFCIQANVKKLILFHHAPEDQDSDVFDKVRSVYAKAQKHGIEVVAAQEGKIWELR